MARITDLPAGTWTVDPAHSELGFVARHLMVTKVRGQFKEFEGTVKVGESIADSQVSAVAQLGSVDTGSADRDAHLKSADFFDVENNPTMSFTSTEVTEDSLKGDLTIKGVTKPVEFELDFGGVATDPWGNQKAGFEASTEINRKDWGLEWNVALEGGGVLVSEKIKINLDIQLLKTA
ncbi:YceI family protein [Nostocoides sp. HKS02]|uniref:YceI family protein n=1 Tax=Nostocoides sp. HKS02 TaxID=1813880 RepID=UPI0012B4934A|nr:YceI family protein [Tetrasphaera sp. HKS02]QGN58331.1 polyisoprenoid-binding protein [Tetrasphaera sp. HKS02]